MVAEEIDAQEAGRFSLPPVRRIQQERKIVRPVRIEAELHLLARRKSAQGMPVFRQQAERQRGRRSRRLAVHLFFEQFQQLGTTLLLPGPDIVHHLAVFQAQELGQFIFGHLGLVVVEAFQRIEFRHDPQIADIQPARIVLRCGAVAEKAELGTDPALRAGRKTVPCPLEVTAVEAVAETADCLRHRRPACFRAYFELHPHGNLALGTVGQLSDFFHFQRRMFSGFKTLEILQGSAGCPVSQLKPGHIVARHQETGHFAAIRTLGIRMEKQAGRHEETLGGKFLQQQVGTVPEIEGTLLHREEAYASVSRAIVPVR